MPSPSPCRVRLRFSKQGTLRLLSHHDLMRCFERMIRRADLPVASTQGFNPRFRLVFASALGLGIEGHREIVDLVLTQTIPADELLRRLSDQAPDGLLLLDAWTVPLNGTASVQSARYQIDLPPVFRETAAENLRGFLDSTSFPYTRRRPNRTVESDLRPCVLSASIDPHDRLNFQIKVTPEGSARPEEFLDALGLQNLPREGSVLIRVEILLHHNGTTTTDQAIPALEPLPDPQAIS